MTDLIALYADEYILGAICDISDYMGREWHYEDCYELY